MKFPVDISEIYDSIYKYTATTERTQMQEDYRCYMFDDPCDDCTHWIGNL